MVKNLSLEQMKPRVENILPDVQRLLYGRRDRINVRSI